MVDRSYLRRVYWRLAGVIMVSVVGALGLVSIASQRAFERELVPESAKTAITVGTSVRALLLKADEFGVKLTELYGVDKTFAEVLSENPQFAYLAITDPDGRLLHSAGTEPAGAQAYFLRSAGTAASASGGAGQATATRVDTLHMVALPIHGKAGPLGVLHIGIGSGFVDRVLLEGMLDVIVVLVVALFFTLELLNLLAGARLSEDLGAFFQLVGKAQAGDFSTRARANAGEGIGGAMAALDGRLARVNGAYRKLTQQLQALLRDADAAARERLRAAAESWESLGGRFRFGDAAAPEAADAGLNRIRAPLFAFILAEELTRSFLPSYVNQLLVPVPGLSPQVVIGLPIVLFMLIVAIGQPYLGVWSERVGRRRAMQVGAIVTAAGFVGTALAVSLYDLLLWRSLCALGYAMVFVAAQGYVLDHTGPATRAQGFGLFVGAIMVATVCGPSIGGILADNIGPRATFGVAAAVAGLSLLAIRLLPREPARAATTRPSRPPRLREILALTFNRRFMTLTGLAAMPAKIILTGVCFYLLPLYIVSIGDTRAMAGRLLMMYAVVMVLVVPLAASLSTGAARRERLVALGLCISGMGGFVFHLFGSFFAVFAIVVMLGLGQAISIAAQSALVGDHCREEIRQYGDDAVYGAYRLLERLGNALGPLLASILVVLHGYEGAFIGISALVLVCGLLFAFLTRVAAPAAPATH